MTNTDAQRAQDMLAAMQRQRDNALNAMVHAEAEIASLNRQVAGLQEQVRQLTAATAEQVVAPTEE